MKEQSVPDHVAAVILMFGRHEGDKGVLGLDTEALLSIALEHYGDWAADDILERAMNALESCGLALSTKEPFANRFYKVDSSMLPTFISTAHKESQKQFKALEDMNLDEASLKDFPAAAALSQHPTFERYNDFGDEWLRRAIQKNGMEQTSGSWEKNGHGSDVASKRAEGLPYGFVSSAATKAALLRHLDEIEIQLDCSVSVNAEKAQARAFLVAIRSLAKLPSRLLI